MCALSVKINPNSKLLNFGNWNEWEYFPSHFLRASEKLYLWFVPICISQSQIISYGCHSRTTLDYRTARGQLNHLVQRAENDEQFGQHYNKVVRFYVEKEFIEQIPNHPVEGHYMPHHAVFNKSATTPLRIVFNASSKPNEGKSLNDCLMMRPSLTAKLHETLVHFSQGTHAVTTDILKAFHCIIVDEEHRKFHKFLWLNLESYELLTYQFKVVLFGATCSPYLLQETLQTHLSQNAEGSKIVDKFYVDNYMNTYDNQDELVTDKVMLDNVMNQASMPLQEWVSNNEHFNSLYQLAVPVTQNVLGISWNPNTDNMNIVVGEKLIHEDSWRYTKRNVLSLVSSIYDPLGWVSPLTVRGKMFIQTLWKEKMGWDQNLNPDQIKVIHDILVDLQRVGEFFFPRHILYEHTELHVFTDTSSRAYGAAVYTVNDTCTRSDLLMSKARVAPCREGRLTIPKLELTASLVGARLIHYLTNLFKFKTIYLWSDSKVAISGITSDRDIKDVYIANRVAEVKTLITQRQVKVMYVPTKDNPADYLSRGCTSKQLKSSNWLHGPSWLLTHEFPEQTSMNVVVNELTVEINPIHPIQPLIDLTKFSSYIRVIRIMTRVLEFRQSPANPFEKLVRQEQLLHCTSIHAHICVNNRVNVNVELKTTIKQLNLYLENDTIRSKGRIINSELPLDATTPLFLPNKSHLVDLLINHIHSSHHHVGLSQMLSLYRQRFWTPKIRSRIKSLLLRCVTCQRVKGKTLPRPLPPPLPAERVQWVAPFNHVGVDHTGSFIIKDTQGRKTKAYICLFVCATTRAVHLEVVDNLTATSFIMCLRRLAAAKAMPTLVLSDNHKTFIVGETFLLDMQQDPSVQEYLASKNVRWKHQTPRSPWMGGHFERLVRTIKASLATAISRNLLTLEEFTTIVKEAENIVNSRPLTYQSDESRDVPLSPSQLAWGRDLTLMPPLPQPGDPPDEDYDARATRAQYVLLSNALEHFRKRWHTEYLLPLREKHYNKCAENPTHHLSVGKLVMVRHDNVHRIECPLVVITAIYPDEKWVIRTAEVEECGR